MKSIGNDVRDIRRVTKAIKHIARDMAEILGPKPVERYRPVATLQGQGVTRIPEPQIPQDYSYVRCISCGAPALLVRDNSNECFAGACLNCCTITHLEAIEDGDEPHKKQ